MPAVIATNVSTGAAELRNGSLVGVSVDNSGNTTINKVVPATTTGMPLVYEQALGVGQTWQDVTASRASGTTYTNSTGKPIMVSIVSNIATGQNVQIEINSVMVTQFVVDAGGNKSVVTIVPNGATYRFTGTNTKWSELR